MTQAIRLPNGFFNNTLTTFINVEVGKSQPQRKGRVLDCGRILTPYGYKTLYKINFRDNTFAWHIN